MAATLTGNGELTYVSFPIMKTETTADGDLVVYGKASDGSVDFDQQIVKPEFARKAVEEWFKSGGNIRVQHNAQRDPAGVGLDWEHDGDATWVKALVCEPVAKRLVAKGALRAYSVGIARPTIERDVTGKARGGIITDGQWVEISLVDRPANKSCGIALVKSVDGTPELSGEVFGTEEAIEKAIGAAETVTKSEGDISSFDPMSIDFTPQDLWRITQEKMASRHDDMALKVIMEAERQVYKRDIDMATRRHAASEGNALPDGSYPILNTEDLGNAAHLARTGHGNASGAKRLIARRAQELGVANPLENDSEKVDTVPGVVKDAAKEAEPDVTKDPAIGGEGPLAGDTDDPKPGGNKIPEPGDCDPDELDKAAMPPKGKGKPKKGKGGKKLPPWLNKPADADDGKAAVGAEAEKCPDPKTASGAEEAADMNEAPLGDLKEYPAKPHMKADGLTEAAMMRYKTIGMDTDLGILHDMTCPAFHPADVAKVFPMADFATMIDEELWQRKALAAATGKSISDAMDAQSVWHAAVTLKFANAAELNDYRADLHKAFRDANPGPTSFPTPCAISPQKYNRPNITDGHAAYGGSYGGPNASARVANSAPNAHGFDRPPLGDGHQSPSPSHMKASFEYPAQQGVPTQIRYAEIEKDKARRALSMMHDHLNHMFPSACPMLDQDAYRQEDGHTLNLPVGVGKSVDTEEQGEVLSDVYRYIKKLEKKVRLGEITEAEARTKLSKRTAQKYAEDLRKQVDKGMTSIEEVRRALGLEPEFPVAELQQSLQKAVGTNGAVLPPGIKNEESVEKGITPDVMKSMMTDILREQMAPLQEKITAQDAQLAEYQQRWETQQNEITKHEQRWEALAQERDPATAGFTGLALNPARSAPAGIAQQAEVSKSVQGMMMRQLERTWRTSENPAEREAAYNALLKYQGKTE